MALFRLVEYQRSPPSESEVGVAEVTTGHQGGTVVDTTLTELGAATGAPVPPAAECGIAIDGCWIHDVSLAQLRASLGVIPQDPTLFRYIASLPVHVGSMHVSSNG
jgi:hypothetical protein